MLGKATKKLIIVCDDKTEAYANYLRQLISTNDDKDGTTIGIADGSVDAAVWLEKDYIANKAQISSNEHILFIGDGKVSRNEASSMIIKYEKYGMKYGWLGKRAMMVVDDEMLKPDTYDEFIDYCLGYQADFEKVAMKRSKTKTIEQKQDGGAIGEEKANNDNPDSKSGKPKNKLAGALAVAGAAAAGAVAGVGALVPGVGAGLAIGINKGINSIQAHKKVKDQQYRALAVILYIDGLQEFMEG